MRKQTEKNKKIIKEIISYAIIVLIVILIRTFIITPVIVNGPSMENTLYDGEMLILSKLSKTINNIKRFDIVVINDNADDELIIKRVIGLPGDTVYYKDNNLYINGKIVEDYGYGETKDFDIADICISGGGTESSCNYETIPDGYYLVLGDNREVSYDSRYIGFIKYEDIKGKVILRLWPLNKLGTIK